MLRVSWALVSGVSRALPAARRGCCSCQPRYTDWILENPGGKAARLFFVAVLAARIITAQAPTPLVIRNASVFDSINGVMLPGRTVVIEDERIKSVGSPEQRVRTPRHARVIDGRG